MHVPLHVIRSLAALTLTSVLVGCASIPVTRHSGSIPATRHSDDRCDALVTEASALVSDFADSSAARVAPAHSAYAAKMAHYHTCLAEHLAESS
jgi:hypothetical protein